MIRVASAVLHPGSMAGAQNRFHRGHKSTGGHNGFNRASAINMFVRLTIGNYEQAAIFQRGVLIYPQSFGGPKRIGGLTQAGLPLRGRAGPLLTLGPGGYFSRPAALQPRVP